MLLRGFVAIIATTAFSQAASAADLPETPAGLVGLTGGAGEAPLDLVDRPGFRLSRSFRLRLVTGDRLDAVAHGATPARVMLLDRSRSRRLASMLDYYPVDGNGFHLSAGMRKLPRPARRASASFSAGSAFDLSGLSATPALGGRSSIARRQPTLTAGWSGMVAKEMQLGFSAGAAEQHGRSYLAGSSMAPGATAQRWSRIGQVAQVNFAMRF